MKAKFLFPVFVVCFSTTFLQAQISLGAKSGVSLSNVDFDQTIDEVLDFKQIAGVQAGGFVEMPFAEHLSLQAELLYTQKGTRLKEGFEDINLFGIPVGLNVRSLARLHYLDLPVMLKYTTGGERARVYLMAGPQVGYTWGGEIRNQARVIGIPLNIGTFDIEPDRKFEFALTGGVGIELPLEAVTLFADARYQHGFTSLYKIPVVDVDIRNRSFAFAAGIKIPLGK